MARERNLGSQAARGASVIFAGQVGRIALQVVSVSVLARLLSPVDYGLIAIVLVIVGFGEIFRDFGLSTAAVQAKHLDPGQRDSLFWLNMAIGLLLGVLAYLVAPLVASIFGNNELESITQLLSITFLINGLGAQYRADLNRRMRFRALVATDLCAQFLSLVIAVWLAVSGFGYWSLVAQQLSLATLILISMVGIGRWLPGRPRRGTNVGELVRFGRNLVGTQLVGYMNSNVDTVVIALRLGPTSLGIYSRGFQLLMRPLNQLRAPSATVALPVLSRIGEDYARSGRYLVTGQLALGYTIIPGLAFAAGASVPLVEVFLGPKWSAVAALFSVLAIAGAFETLAYVGSWVYLSRNLTGKLFYYSLASLLIKVICVVVGSFWGLTGVAAGYAIAPAIAWPISLWWLSRLTTLPARELWFGANRVILCGATAGVLSYLVVQLMVQEPAGLQMLAAAAVVILVYVGTALLVGSVRDDLKSALGTARMAVRR